MVYIGGTPADYDGWRQSGCEGWDWDSVLPFFRKAEDQARGECEHHGVGGPLRVTDHRWKPPLAEALVEAAIQAGIAANPDFNGPHQARSEEHTSELQSLMRIPDADVVLKKKR